jgi:hypothetical protein
MDTTLKCPKCGADIPLTDAFRKEIEADVLAEEHARHAMELDEVRSTAASLATRRTDRRLPQRRVGSHKKCHTEFRL